VIIGNLLALKSHVIEDVQAVYSNGHLHFTLNHSSWLNQLELRLGKVWRYGNVRGVFTRATDLKRKLRRYSRFYYKCPRTAQWKSANSGRHFGATISVGGDCV
jgi:hypothetical protein